MVAMATAGCGLSNSPKTSITPKIEVSEQDVGTRRRDNLMTIPMCKSETLAGNLL